MTEQRSDETHSESLPVIETRPKHRRSVQAALALAFFGAIYLAFLFTRNPDFLLR